MGKGLIAALAVGATVSGGAGWALAQADAPALMQGVRLDGWTFVNEDRKGQRFARREGDIGGFPVMASRVEYRVDQGDPGKPAFSYSAIDAFRCSDGATRGVSRSMYAGHNLTQRVSHDDLPQLWEPVPPDSFMAILFSMACGGAAPTTAPARPAAPIDQAPATPAPAVAEEEEDETPVLIAGVVQGDWIFLDESEESQLLLQVLPETRAGNPAFRVRFEHREAARDGRRSYLSSAVDYEIRCRDGRSRQTRVVSYPQHNLKGRAQTAEPIDTWTESEEDSLIGELVAAACHDEADPQDVKGGSPRAGDDEMVLMPGVILGEWTPLSDTDQAQVFVRAAEASPTDNPHIWMRTEVRAGLRDGPSFKSMLSLVEIDCGRSTYRLVQIDTFAGHNMTGRRRSELGETWAALKPASPIEEVRDLLCETAK